jgi:hypothetical protein
MVHTVGELVELLEMTSADAEVYVEAPDFYRHIVGVYIVEGVVYIDLFETGRKYNGQV